MLLTEVFLGMGGNIGDTQKVFEKVLLRLISLPEISSLKVSNFYVTTPVSSLVQAPFLNAVCQFKTSQSVEKLFEEIQNIETSLGKFSKPKDAPRIIDLDILFFGSLSRNDAFLEIPHPRWQERLFVLKPLSDLIQEVSFVHPENQLLTKINLKDLLETFPNIHKEKVSLFKNN